MNRIESPVSNVCLRWQALSSTGKLELIGNRTECGLLKFLQEDLTADYKELRTSKDVIRSWPFSSQRKRMGTLVANGLGNGAGVYHVKGAPEIVLGLCKKQVKGNLTTVCPT